MLITKSVAAATAVVGYDLLVGDQNKTVGYDRVLTGLALGGSAASADCAVEVLVGNELVATAYNVATGHPTKDHWWPMAKIVPANTPLTAKVIDAPATNPIILLLTLDP